MIYLSLEFSPYDIITLYIDDFINVIKGGLQVQIKIKDISDK